MSLKSHIAPCIASKLLGEKRLLANRSKFERQRIKACEAHKVEFFHDPSDPYSQLMQTALQSFQVKYDVQIITHLVGPPDEGAAPERDKLSEYSKMDAMRLTKKAGVDFEIEDHPPASNTSEANARRRKLGHYLGGTLYYGGEWYWGLDRLHYLEERLTGLELRKPGTGSDFIYAPPGVPSGSGDTGAELHWYLSFRSPYTGIVVDRVKALADAYGADIKLRFVLPMVMRGLPVPKIKGQYIILDTAREARRLGVPFGRVCDPVGEPVERGYSLLPWAIEQGRGFEFVSAFLKMVWSEGVDAGRDKGMRKIVETAGLDWSTAKPLIGNDDWRPIAEANRVEMMELGVWGVPSFRISDTITWGQDRLWVIEHALQKLIN